MGRAATTPTTIELFQAPRRVLYTTVQSPLGSLLLAGDEGELWALSMLAGWKTIAIEPGWVRAREPFERVEAQLEEYFAGRRTRFDLPVAPRGTAFQRDVWQALRDIPYGETVTYRELACRLGRPEAARAVGAANGRNPIAVIVPCHRLVGSDGSLTGFAGGLERKRLLLDLELRRVAPAPLDRSDDSRRTRGVSR